MITFKFFKKTVITEVNNGTEEVNATLMSCGPTPTPTPTESPLLTLMFDDDFVTYEKEMSTHNHHSDDSIVVDEPMIVDDSIVVDEPVIVDTITSGHIVRQVPITNYSLGFTTLYEVCSHFVSDTETINKIEGMMNMSDFCQSTTFELSPSNSYVNLLDGEYWLSNGTYGRKVLKTGLILNFDSDCIICGTEPNTLFVRYSTF